MILAAVHVAHVVVDKALTITDSGWAIFAAWAAAIAAGASALAAIGTSLLALVTWNLVSKTAAMSTATKDMAEKTAAAVIATKELASTQELTFRKAETAKLIWSYFQDPVQASHNISITVHNAVSEILNFSTKLERLKELKVKYSQEPTSDKEKTERKQYRTVAEAVTIVSNFFSVAAMFNDRDFLDERAFFNTFARTFVKLWEALLKVNAIVEAATPEQIAQLGRFKVRCEDYVKQNAA
jgi:hypothetical protein